MSIRTQLICAATVAPALLMSIFVFGAVERQREFLLSKTRQQVLFQAVSLADGSEHLVLTNDVAAIDEVIASLSIDSQVRFAMVTDPSGVVLAHGSAAMQGKLLIDDVSRSLLAGPATARVYLQSSSLIAAAAPILVQGHPIGWAWVGRDFSVDHAYLRAVVIAGILYTIAAAAVGAIVAILLANKLTLPLRLLLAGAKRLEQDRLLEPIPLVTGNEVRTVIQAFNLAMKRLADQRDALRKEVDDRVHAEHELHQIYGLSHRRAAELDAVIESLPEAVFIGTEQGVTKCNARALTLLKVDSPGELTAINERQIVLGADDRKPVPRVQMPFSRALRGEATVAEMILRPRDGDSDSGGDSGEIFVRVAAAPVVQNGRIVGAVSVATDVTAEKLEQEKLRRAKADAEEANRAKDHFLAVLSHELRTPLTPVLTLAQMMERDPQLPADAREDVTTIRRNVELEARLIDDLLDLTRISRGKIELVFLAVDLHEKIGQVMRMCQSEAGAKSLVFAADLQAARHVIQGDATRLQQVLWNLIRNAVKFTHAGDRITVRTRNGEMADERRTPSLIVDVIDTGIGIEPAALQRVFEAFEQGGREVTRSFGGLGLGLTISKALVDLHSGRLTAASEGRDRGATFTVELPLSPENQAAPLADQTIGDGEAMGRRILLVEDHADTAKATARLLTQCGYGVQTAATVAQAIRLARSCHFDLIISDIGLPDGSGHDLIRQLVAEATDGGDTVRGIAISGFGQPADLTRSEEAGFMEHLVKPVDPSVLLHAVDDALHKE